jgi:DNA mismatch endonuclease (patch repair protein)
MTWPAANAAWWRAKIERNYERDRETDALLVAADWLPLRVWEHESSEAAAERIAVAVEERRARSRECSEG